MWRDTQLRNYAPCGDMTSNQLGQLEKLFFDRDSGGHSDNSEVHTVTESRHVMDLPAPCQHSRRSITDARSPAVFGYLNIRSLLNKFDDVVELFRDRHIDLTESWHDADSAVLCRLRCAGFNAVGRACEPTLLI